MDVASVTVGSTHETAAEPEGSVTVWSDGQPLMTGRSLSTAQEEVKIYHLFCLLFVFLCNLLKQVNRVVTSYFVLGASQVFTLTRVEYTNNVISMGNIFYKLL